MAWFKCFIEGRNFPGAMMKQDRQLGFFTTRSIEAATTQEAETKALEFLRTDRTFQLPAGVLPSEEARVYFESIVEIDESEARSIANSGATWFPMEED